jgi:hypothetical protein
VICSNSSDISFNWIAMAKVPSLITTESKSQIQIASDLLEQLKVSQEKKDFLKNFRKDNKQELMQIKGKNPGIDYKQFRIGK